MGVSVFLFLALPFFLLLLLSLCTAQNYRRHFCLGVNYTANSKFQDNLNILLSSVSNKTSLRNTRFYNVSVGRAPDNVYGLFQCRFDFSFGDCRRFADMAAQEIKTWCPTQKEAIIFYDESWLHYSNTSLSTVQLTPTACFCHENNVSHDPTLFSQKRAELMDRAVVKAVYNSSHLFAVGEENLTDSDMIYGLVQCAEDLSRSDCNRCLREAVSQLPRCCDKSFGGRILKPSCNARFESYQFFQTNLVAPSPVPTDRNNTSVYVPGLVGKANQSPKNIVVIVVPTVIAVVLIFIIALWYFLRRKTDFEFVELDETTSADSLQFNFATVAAATENFSDANKLGEGGFGAVYKGKLPDGSEIAVKRLSRHSREGVKQFKNELLLLAKLHHRNLVRLLGFCLEGGEKTLINEYVPNASLDHFLFDPTKRAFLDWGTRYKIIEGIARALLYLHEESRDTIIHCDLKASNVLLDAQMNPKIANFGLARLCDVDQMQGTISNIVATFGYMAPEYVMHGQFSPKTDVFSFGVLVLEIISGRRNNESYESELSEGLLDYAWMIWDKGSALEMLDPTLGESYSRSEVMGCIHTALICVQKQVQRRPSMASVVLMLNSNSISVPSLSEPAYFVNGFTMKDDKLSEESKTNTRSSVQSIPLSVNEVSITEIYPP